MEKSTFFKFLLAGVFTASLLASTGACALSAQTNCEDASDYFYSEFIYSRMKFFFPQHAPTDAHYACHPQRDGTVIFQLDVTVNELGREKLPQEFRDICEELGAQKFHHSETRNFGGYHSENKCWMRDTEGGIGF